MKLLRFKFLHSTCFYNQVKLLRFKFLHRTCFYNEVKLLRFKFLHRTCFYNEVKLLRFNFFMVHAFTMKSNCSVLNVFIVHAFIMRSNCSVLIFFLFIRNIMTTYIPSKKSSAQVGVWVNSVLTRNDFIKYYIPLFKKSFCKNVMHSRLKSKIPLRNCVHLKRLGVTPQKW